MKSIVVILRPRVRLSFEHNNLVGQLLCRLAENFDFQGMEDWSIEVPKGTHVLGIESEWHDLRSFAKDKQNFKLYFKTKLHAKKFARLVGASIEDIEIVSITKAQEVDWVKKWRRFYKPQKIVGNASSPILWILPAWTKRRLKKNEFSLHIEPGQAFGTGTHETTQLCLEFLLQQIDSLSERAPIKVLDFGAGTGILAIAAGKIFKKLELTCVEIDKRAHESLVRNLNLNRIRARIKTNGLGGRNDLIFANVLAPVLIEHQKSLWTSLRPGGFLIASGILLKELPHFLNEFLPKISRRQLAVKARGDWVAVMLEKL